MRWNQGRAEIERMLADGQLQRVQPSRDQSNRLIKQAREHLASAESICGRDPAGG